MMEIMRRKGIMDLSKPEFSGWCPITEKFRHTHGTVCDDEGETE